jgi:2-keto-4-pentenoate hydratase/2-oxohepta-3-ene-1,7-dioic acid hydratase in catechol pathway
MKIVRFEDAGKIQLGVLIDQEKKILPFEQVDSKWTQSDLPEWLEESTDESLEKINRAVAEAESKREAIDAASVKWLSPIGRPIHDILCVGVNYNDHREETKEAIVKFVEPPKTVYFGKRATRIIGPDEAIEACFDVDALLDYEVELAVIIGKKGRDIAPEDAESYIFGYSVFNDISSRQLQRDHVQWYRGKSLDTYSAMGPCVLLKSALPFPVDVEISSTVNGEPRQKSRTTFMIAGLPELIADLSRGMTLEPGDIIATGTPSGVGMGFNPPKYMVDGDVVTCQIEGIGSLTNTVQRRHDK